MDIISLIVASVGLGINLSTLIYCIIEIFKINRK